MSYCSDFLALQRATSVRKPAENACARPDVVEDLRFQSFGRFEFAFIAHAAQKLDADALGRGRMNGTAEMSRWSAPDARPNFRNVGR